MKNLGNWINYLAYAGGFAAGNFFGMILEEKLAIGHEVVRIITKREAHDLINSLKEKGYGITTVDAQGSKGDVSIIYTIIKRSDVKRIVDVIRKYNPNAIYTVEDVRSVNGNLGLVAPEVKKRLWRFKS